MPAIPPEVLEAILLELPADDAETIPTLLACSLVSHDMKDVARSDFLWKRIVEHRYKGRAPTFVDLADAEDRQDLFKAFPEGHDTSLNLNGRLAKRPVIVRIIDRHVGALLAEPTHKVSHVLALVELGDTNVFPFLDQLVSMTDESLHPDDWLARRYWAREVRGAISRRKAIDVWRRIGEGWDDLKALSEGVFAFSVFYEEQKLPESIDDRAFCSLLDLTKKAAEDQFSDKTKRLSFFAYMLSVKYFLKEGWGDYGDPSMLFHSNSTSSALS